MGGTVGPEIHLSDRDFFNAVETDSHSYRIFIAVLDSVIGLLGLTGNGLMILSFYLFVNLRTVNNKYLLSIAIADFIQVLVACPITTITTYNGRFDFNLFVCDLLLSVQYVMVDLIVPYTLVLAAHHMYNSLTQQPTAYKPWNATYKISILWAISWLIVVPMVVSHPDLSQRDFEGTCYLELANTPYFVIIQAIVCYGIPVIYMVYLWIKWLVSGRKKKLPFASRDSNQIEESTSQTQEQEYKTFIVIALVFAAVAFPTYTAWPFPGLPMVVWKIIHYLYQLRYVVVPICYGIFNLSIRVAYLKIIRCQCRPQHQ